MFTTHNKYTHKLNNGVDFSREVSSYIKILNKYEALVKFSRNISQTKVRE